MCFTGREWIVSFLKVILKKFTMQLNGLSPSRNYPYEVFYTTMGEMFASLVQEGLAGIRVNDDIGLYFETTTGLK